MRSEATSAKESQSTSRGYELLQFCNTEKQAEAIRMVYIEGMSRLAAARELGIDDSSLRERLRQVEKRAARFEESDVYEEEPVKVRKPKAKRADEGLRIMVIPDTQVKPGVDTAHIAAAARYALKMQPDTIVMIGDWYDMPSLSSYDKKGGRNMEGRRYWQDIRAGNDAMDLFMGILRSDPDYDPRLVFCIGNHEQRIERCIDQDAQLEDLISMDDFNLKEHGWEVYPFLQPVEIGGVAFVHYVTSGVMGRSITSARAGLTKRHQSFVQGHVQTRDIAETTDVMGRRQIGLMSGIFYQHDEDYLSYQSRTGCTWSGVWILHDVKQGQFDYMPVSTDFLMERYG